MNQKKLASWLKITVITVFIICSLVFFVLIPLVIHKEILIYSQFEHLFWPSLIYSWGIACICFACLVIFYGICDRIGKDRSFCPENANAMFSISKLALVSAILSLIGLVILTVSNCMSAGFLIGFLLFVFICIAVSVAAAALSHLIRKAAELQSANDLTV